MRLRLGAVLAIALLAATPGISAAADKPKGSEISRVIAKEMTAAQKALQAGQWAEALKNLDEAETEVRADRLRQEDDLPVQGLCQRETRTT